MAPIPEALAALIKRVLAEPQLATLGGEESAPSGIAPRVHPWSQNEIDTGPVHWIKPIPGPK